MSRKNSAAAIPHDSPGGESSIREFTNSSLPPGALRAQATALLAGKNLVVSIQGLTTEEQTRFVDKVYQIYATLDPQNMKEIAALGSVCSAIQKLPTSVVLSTGLEKLGEIAVASGGFTDIWQGSFEGVRVAIKAFRIYPVQNLKEAKEILWKRVPMWTKLSHPNILPFHGVNMALFQLSLVYEWGTNGNITQYIASNPRVSRKSLLFGVAKGLRYLHSLGISHGDLKGANVVIDRKGHARLTEYGLAPINSDPSFTVAATPGSVGASRWLAPEIIAPARKGTATPVMESKAADVFAFGMFAVEVFTGKIPFEEQKNEAVVLRISQGGRPEIPKNAGEVGLTDEIWSLLGDCWNQNPKKRPTMEEVVMRWQGFVGNDDNLSTFPHGPQSALDQGRRRLKTEATNPRIRTEPTRHRTTSETVGRRQKQEAGRLRTSSTAVKVERGLGAIPQSPDSAGPESSPIPAAAKERPEAPVPAPVYETPPTSGGGGCCCIVM